MVVTNRDDLAEKVRVMRSHGMTSLTWDRHHGHAYTYDVVALGYNYRIDEIRSALGLVQLHKLEANNGLRKKYTERYWEAFDNSQIGLPFHNASGEPAYHIFPILLPKGVDRLQFIDRMKAAGIQTSIHYPPIHLFSYYHHRYPEVVLPRTEDIAAREVTLPLYPTMDDRSINHVIASVCSSVEALSSR
jgi:dTDP-4-amino-4,6-dideoxygalactose transaminase